MRAMKVSPELLEAMWGIAAAQGKDSALEVGHPTKDVLRVDGKTVAWSAKQTKPTEPQGLGAVVEDTRGEFWVRKGKTEHGEDWARQIGNAWTGGGWDRIDVARVLSEGVSA